MLPRLVDRRLQGASLERLAHDLVESFAIETERPDGCPRDHARRSRNVPKQARSRRSALPGPKAADDRAVSDHVDLTRIGSRRTHRRPLPCSPSVSPGAARHPRSVLEELGELLRAERRERPASRGARPSSAASARTSGASIESASSRSNVPLSTSNSSASSIARTVAVRRRRLQQRRSRRRSRPASSVRRTCTSPVFGILFLDPQRALRARRRRRSGRSPWRKTGSPARERFNRHPSGQVGQDVDREVVERGQGVDQLGRLDAPRGLERGTSTRRASTAEPLDGRPDQRDQAADRRSGNEQRQQQPAGAWNRVLRSRGDDDQTPEDRLPEEDRHPDREDREHDPDDRVDAEPDLLLGEADRVSGACATGRAG